MSLFALTTTTFPVQVEGKCRSEKWELYLFGDMIIKVHRGIVEVLPRGVSPVLHPTW